MGCCQSNNEHKRLGTSDANYNHQTHHNNNEYIMQKRYEYYNKSEVKKKQIFTNSD